jgi:hypothetical protein
LETDVVVNGRLEDSELCVVSLHKIKELARNSEAFIHVLKVSTEETTRLVDHTPFRDWIKDYTAQKSEVLNGSILFRSEIMQDGGLAWRFCSLLMSWLGAPTSTSS